MVPSVVEGREGHRTFGGVYAVVYTALYAAAYHAHGAVSSPLAGKVHNPCLVECSGWWLSFFMNVGRCW